MAKPNPDDMKRCEGVLLRGNGSLRAVIPGGITVIGPGAFSESSITEVILPQGLLEIGQSAFKECRSLKRIFLPPGLKRIGRQAFSGCIALEELTLPDTLESIGAQAFAWCSSLRTLRFTGSVKEWGDLLCRGCHSLQSVCCPKPLPDKAFQYSAWYAKKMTAEGRCPVCGQPIARGRVSCANPDCPTQYGKWER